jgi:hypothetical protein
MLRTEHSLYGLDIATLCGQVARFATEHPREVVILHLRKFRLR